MSNVQDTLKRLYDMFADGRLTRREHDVYVTHRLMSETQTLPDGWSDMDILKDVEEVMRAQKKTFETCDYPFNLTIRSQSVGISLRMLVQDHIQALKKQGCDEDLPHIEDLENLMYTMPEFD